MPVKNILEIHPKKYVYKKSALKHCVAMALIKGGNQLMGKKIFISKTNSSETVEAEIVNPVFLDPKNKRLTS